MSDKARKILESLESSGQTGRGIITLSLETGIEQSELRDFFRKHKNYCEALNGETKFKLNRLSKERGSVDEMIAAIERRRVSEIRAGGISIGLVLGLFIGNLDSILRSLF